MRVRDVKGYEGLYYVTDTGEVWSYDREYTIPIHNIKKIRKGRKIKTSKGTNGYLSISLCKNGIVESFSHHRLVAFHFIKNPLKKPQVNHKNGIKTDNRAENLEWMTAKENSFHAFKTGLSKVPMFKGEQIGTSKLKQEDILKIRQLLKKGLFQKDIAKLFKIDQTTVSDIKLRKRWNHIS